MSAEELHDDQHEEQDEEHDDEEEVSIFDLPGAERPPLDVREIPLDDIAERSNIRPAYHGIESLAETMHARGQLQPCVVRPAPADAEHGKPFELIFGYRRKRAAELLRERDIEGWETLRCEVREASSDEQISDMIVENFQREQLSPVAEARAMFELKHTSDPPMSNAEVARRLGCDPSHVSHRLSMYEKLAPPKLQRQLQAQKALGPAAKVAGAIELTTGAGDDGETAEDEQVEVVANPEADAAEAAGVAESLDSGADSPEEEDGVKVDILEMVDKGEISASTAEVIASLDKREDQEKLAQLVKRHDWGVKKAAKWAREVQEHKLDEGSEAMGPIEMLEMEDVTELPKLRLRDDITDAEVARIALYALLRNGMDQEMLDYLDEKMGYPYESLWSYVRELTDEQVAELTKRLALRYVTAAHRWFDLDPELKDDLSAPEDADAELAEALTDLALALPGASEMEALPEARDA